MHDWRRHFKTDFLDVANCIVVLSIMACYKLGKLHVFLYMWLWQTISFHVKAVNDSLKPGDILNNTTELCSENRTYCLRFGPTSNIKDGGYLRMYYEGENGWVVWIANRNQPVDLDSATLLLNHSGVLEIKSKDKESIILYSSPQPVHNTVAILLDTGNFVLQQLHSNGSKNVLWQSFDYPGDTLIPGMKLGVNHRSGHNWSLVSWFSKSIPAPGPFRLEWEPQKKELIIKRQGQVCWRSGELRKKKRLEHVWESQYTVVSNEDEDSFELTFSNDERIKWTLMENGQLINREGSDIARADLCYGYNTEEGCQKWEEIPKCRHHGDAFQIVQGFPDSNMRSNLENSSYGVSDCRAICWNNCSCTAFKEYYDNGTGCVFFHWHSMEGTNIASTGEDFYMLVKHTDHKGAKKWIWISIVMAISLFVICLYYVGFALKKRKYIFKGKQSRGMEIKMFDLTGSNRSSGIKDLQDDLKGHGLKAFDYTLVVEATNDFLSENKLGQGGFGPVYKGVLPTGQEVAVKRLSKASGQGIVEFKNEVTLISELQHMNLVQLLGCCIHEEERILVYQYMPNKSLDFYLFDGTRSKLLDWKKRFNIIEGISQGLLYLHKYSRLKIIHRDLKASNILLDENMNPKISDFGMARMFSQQESVSSTNRIVGTYGYMSPEYAMEGVFSTKSDVYSFGVLLLEIISGRRNNSFHDANDDPLNIIGHAWELWNNGMSLQLVDPSLNELFDPDEVQRCIHVGLLCVEQYPNDRPTMSNVISMLKKSAAITLPQRPAFCSGRQNFDGKTYSKELFADSTEEITSSFTRESM
ncbi:hypothetical protein VNO78_06130 [Psophocarpus tetragonolobus]|uniref:Receptor-like serine/threonine-protein kinase n=1 Tax=Psophocarpus tetragonolobus TaxID=3891 RepID=A0AAN9XRY5_PSOTE